MKALKRKIKRPHLTIEGRKAMAGRLFVLPFYIGFILFFLGPAVQSIWFAFCDVTLDVGSFNTVFVGLKNWRYIFLEDPDFNKNLVSALGSMLYQVPVILIASLFFALILNQRFPGRTLVRAIFFLPVIIASGVVMSIITGDYFATSIMSSTGSSEGTASATSFGLQQILISMGLSENIVEYFTWISSNLFDLMWRTGIQMIIFLAGLQTISPSLYEASAMEGASAWENFWMITIPMLSPMILVNLVYTVVDTFTDTNNPVMSMIDDTFHLHQYDRAAAMSWVYFLLVGAILMMILLVYSRHNKQSI